MQIPTDLVIFGRRYRIRNLSAIHSAEGVLGLAAYREGAIYLDPDLDPASTLSTLWHEAAHVAQQDILGTIDEAQARWVSVFVHDLLVRNPAIVECYLTAHEIEDALEIDEED